MANKKELDILFKATKINKSFGGFKANIDIDISIKKGEIHALLGENGAGKSTLVKIFYGVLKPDSGTIEINNQLVSISSPKSARTNGVGMVFQHFSLFPALTVAENILIALDQKISFQQLISDIRKLSEEWDLFIDPLRLISQLSVGERQRVEIIRCLMQNPKLLIMDEPTSVLTPQEIENLFKILKRLSKSGCSILYISHKLEEIIELANQVTILKSGKCVSTLNAKTTSTKELAETMVGKKITKLKKNNIKNNQTVAFEVRNLNKIKDNDFGINLKNINLKINYGEILGIAGIAGNGQNELMEVLSGEVICNNDNEILLENVPIGKKNITLRRKLGIEPIPEERTLHATVPNFYGKTAMTAGFWSIVSVILLSFYKKNTRMSVVDLLGAFESGIKSTVPVTIACACAGIIIGSVFVSGLGLKFTQSVIDLSGGMLFPLLCLTAVSAIILGMGMTTTAVYITVAALIVPSLIEAGILPIAAHMFAFYFGVVSTITPPVALASFAGAAIAKSPPMATAFESSKVGIAKYIVPFAFIYNPSLLMEGPRVWSFYSLISVLLAYWSMTLGLEGWFNGKLNVYKRTLALIGSVCLLIPPLQIIFEIQGFYYNVIGILLLGLIYFVQGKLNFNLKAQS